jgi:hypothetical protein
MVKKTKEVNKKRSLKGALIKGYLERIDRKAFEYLFKDFQQLLGKSSGIYALYNKGNLYYVGIADSLLDRVDQHTHDRHQNKWNSVSFFIIDKHKYSKDIETVILRIIKEDISSEPKGNRTRGKFAGHYEYQGQLIAIRRRLKDIAKRL